MTGIKHTDAQKILEADNKALLDRVKAGKPLTAEQRRRVESIAAGAPNAGNTKVTSAEALSKELDTTRQTVHSWLKQDGNPGRSANGEYNVVEWRQWVNDHGKKGAEQTDEKKEWEARKARADAERAELELHKMQGQLVDINEVTEWLINLTTPAVKMLDSMAPSLARKLGKKKLKDRAEIISEFTRSVREQIAGLPGKVKDNE